MDTGLLFFGIIDDAGLGAVLWGNGAPEESSFHFDPQLYLHGADRRPVWGRSSIVDTKPFMPRVVFHRTIVHKPRETGTGAWPVSFAGYRKSQCTL